MTTSYAHLPPSLPAQPMQELPGRRHRWDVGPGAFLGPGAFPAPGGVVRPNDLSETEFEDDVEGGPEIISSKDYTDDESDDDDSGSDSDCDSDEEDASTPHPATVKQHPTFPPTHHHPAHHPAPVPAVHVQPRMQPRGGSPAAPPLSPQVIQQIEQVVKNELPGVVKKLNGAPAGPEPRGSGLNIDTKNGRYPSPPSSTHTEPGIAPPPPPQRPVYQNHGPSVSGPAKVIPPGVLTPSSSPQPSPTSASQQPQVYRSNSGAVVQPRSGPPSPSSQRGPVRFTDRGHPVLKGDGSGGSIGGSSPVELSAVDQKWGVLFNQRGEPTERVENVFRGVARYLIDELEPPNSIVVTPQKMHEYYKRHAVSNEPASLAWLFRSSTPASYSALSELYQALGAEHHLVPAGRGECPTVPGLTPDGFVAWCTAMVLAHPDEEAARLQSVFQSWPVNCDGPKGLGNSERLPKMLSRHLLPAKHVESRRAMFQGAVQKFRDTIRQANSAGRITSSVLRAERRGSIALGSGSTQMAGTNSRPGRYSDDEIMRKPPVRFKEPVYIVSNPSHRTRRLSHGSNASARGASPKGLRNSSLPSPRSASGSIGSSSTGSSDPARRNSTRDRSPSQSKSHHRHSKADGSYDKTMSSGTAIYHSSSRHGGERKYHGGSRERERERERERDRDRDHEKKRDRTRERERERDRNRDRDRDTEYRLSSHSSGRRRSEMDETPRRRNADKDPRGPTWSEMSSGKQFMALLKTVTKELDGS